MGHDLMLDPVAPAYILSLNRPVSLRDLATIQEAWKRHGLDGKLIVIDDGATLTPVGVMSTPIYDQLVVELGDPFEVAA